MSENLEKLSEGQFEWLVSISKINQDVWSDVSFSFQYILPVMSKNIRHLSPGWWEKFEARGKTSKRYKSLKSEK